MERNRFSAGLHKQFNDSMTTKEAYSSANGKSSSKVFNTNTIAGTPFLKLEKDKTYTMMFVPYEVSNAHPKVQQGAMDAGDYAYVLDYTRHIVGMNNTRVVCPRGTFGHTCPICDKQFDLRRNEADEAEIKALKATRRVLYNVVLMDDPSKLYLLDESHFLFEKEILTELGKGNEDGETYDIADFCVGAASANNGMGYALKVIVTEDKVGPTSFNRYAFKVVRNRTAVNEEVLDKAVKLDKAIIELSAADLEAILYGENSSEYNDDIVATPAPVEKYAEAKYTIGVPDADESLKALWGDVPEVAPQKSCPHGYEFGVDTNAEDECTDCRFYAECYAEKKRRRAAR